MKKITKMNEFDTCKGIDDLKKLIDIGEKELGFKHGRIKVFLSSYGYNVEIDGKDYSTDVSLQEAEATIRDLFNGIRLVIGSNSFA